MDIQSHKISTTRTAHYFTRGILDSKTPVIWLVCHGYGQTADHFIKKFSGLAQDHVVVAPEALNSFYWHDGERRPVASWMTSRHRDDEITDYLTYLHSVLAHVKAKSPGARLIVFGFSQGCATAARLAYAGFYPVSDLVLWSGDFPRDVHYLTDSVGQVWHIVGSEDFYITPSRYQLEKEYISKVGLDVRWITFDGSHRIEPGVFEKLIENMNLPK